jgi:hypothetical protein
MKYLSYSFKVICLLITTAKTMAQDLEPRAYARVPIDATVLLAGFGYSAGGVVTDATLPVKDINAYVNSPSFGAVRSFSFLGQTAQVSVGLPYMWAKVSGSIAESVQSISRTGFGDARLRFSVLVHGAPAMRAGELAKAPKRTVVGASLTITAPTGQYINGKFINLGTNRWSFKPELALSEPVGNRWLIDLYAGIWFFTNNNSFYPGSTVRSQDPMGSFQGHLSYNISLRAWAALDFTYYIGGTSSVNGVANNDRQENSRIGGTIVLPVGKRNTLKFAYSTGAIIRFGANFTTVSIGWQTILLSKPKKPVSPTSNP